MTAEGSADFESAACLPVPPSRRSFDSISASALCCHVCHGKNATSPRRLLHRPLRPQAPQLIRTRDCIQRSKLQVVRRQPKPEPAMRPIAICGRADPHQHIHLSRCAQVARRVRLRPDQVHMRAFQGRLQHRQRRRSLQLHEDRRRISMEHRRLNQLQHQLRRPAGQQCRVVVRNALPGSCQIHLRRIAQRRQQIERDLRVVLLARQTLEREQADRLLMQFSSIVAWPCSDAGSNTVAAIARTGYLAGSRLATSSKISAAG